MENKCNCNMIHKEIVEDTKTKMPDNLVVNKLANLYKLFSDNTRSKILIALSNNEMCGCDLANLLNMSQSAISHQLRALNDGKLIKKRREGKVIYFSLDDEHVFKILNLGLEHVGEIL